MKTLFVFPSGVAPPVVRDERTKSSEWKKSLLEVAEATVHESVKLRSINERKVSSLRAQQPSTAGHLRPRPSGAFNGSQHETPYAFRYHRSQPALLRVRDAPSSGSQENPETLGYYHHHCHGLQERWARLSSRRRMRKRHQSSAHDRSLGLRQQRLPRLQFSQPEYHVTLREDVPLHTSLLTVRLTACMY